MKKQIRIAIDISVFVFIVLTLAMHNDQTLHMIQQRQRFIGLLKKRTAARSK